MFGGGNSKTAPYEAVMWFLLTLSQTAEQQPEQKDREALRVAGKECKLQDTGRADADQALEPQERPRPQPALVKMHLHP